MSYMSKAAVREYSRRLLLHTFAFDPRCDVHIEMSGATERNRQEPEASCPAFVPTG